jgi:hypothetical protein
MTSQFQTITPIDGEAFVGNTRYHGFNTIAAVLSNGEIAVVTDQADGAVAVTRYTSAGAVIGDRIYVARPAGFADSLGIVPLENGGFVVTWTEYGFWPNPPVTGPHPSRTPFGHYVVYDAAGNAVASGERVHAAVSATSLKGGGFALGWGIVDGTPHSETQIFTNTGVAQGPATSFASGWTVTLFAGGHDGGYFAALSGGMHYIEGGAAGPLLPVSMAVQDTAVLTDGRVVLVGSVYSGTDGQDVYAQIYDPATGSLSAATRVNVTAAGNQTAANVVALEGGRYLVTWQNDVAGVEDDPLMARQFLANGTGGDELSFSSDIVGRKPDGTLVGTRLSFFTGNGTDNILLQDYAVSDAAVDGGGGGGGSDFNGDGKPDLLWQNDDGRAAAWLLNATDLMSSAVVGPNLGHTWHIRGTGDFDGNGRSDIVWQNDDGRVAIWFLNGMNLADDETIASNPGPSWDVIDTGHFNTDGKSDLLWQNDDGRVAVWTLNGTTQIGGAVVGPNPGPSWNVKASADFNGDGKSDILWQNDDGRAAVWILDGMNFVRGAVVGENPGASWHIKDSGDFNGDGKSDILWQNDDGRAAVWFLDGLSFLGGSVVGSNPGPLWQAEAAADYNGDGTSDILWQHDNGQAAVWLIGGFGVIEASFVGPNPGPTWHVDWI